MKLIPKYYTYINKLPILAYYFFTIRIKLDVFTVHKVYKL